MRPIRSAARRSADRRSAARLFAAFVLGTCTEAWVPTATSSQLSPPPGLDDYVEQVMEPFEVPGLSVAIVKDDQVVLAKGYGVRKLGGSAPVDDETLFGIASNTKAFTAAALGILAEEGRLEWDAPVVRYLPSFQMYDPWVAQQITIRDLLVHRSGLGLGAGDLMFGHPPPSVGPSWRSASATSRRPRASVAPTPTTMCCTQWPGRSSPR